MPEQCQDREPKCKDFSGDAYGTQLRQIRRDPIGTRNYFAGHGYFANSVNFGRIPYACIFGENNFSAFLHCWRLAEQE